MEIRVVVTSAVAFYREALSHVLEAREGLTVVGAPDPTDLIRVITQLRPDVVLLHVEGGAGPQAVRSARSAVPGARLVALAADDEDSVILEWAEAGISGYVPREGSVAQIVETVRMSVHGGAVCPPHVAAVLLRRVADQARDLTTCDPRLTRREAEVARLLQHGLTNKEIGRALHLAVPTVKNHVHNILEKLHVSHRVDVPLQLTGPEPSRSGISLPKPSVV